MGAAVCYTVAFALLWGPFKRPACVSFLVGLAANGVSAVCRYANAWPMLPLYQTPFFLPLLLGVLCVRPMLRQSPGNGLRLFPILYMTFLALFFPKDYYLPFVHSSTLFAHLFLFFGALGKACLFMAAAEAALLLLPLLRSAAISQAGQSLTNGVMRWIAWGFGSLTFSMFAGEIWSYLGWGSPIVWDDPAVLSSLSIWCMVACLLHVHLARSWGLPKRLGLAVAGAVLIFFFTTVAEIGVFQWPKWN